MKKMTKVDLSPYTSIVKLIQNGLPNYTTVEKVSGKFDKFIEGSKLKKAIYGENFDLGDD